MDFTGKVFGNLTVIERYGSFKDENLWLCQCNCGNRQIALQGRLLDGSVTNCGCKTQRKKRKDISGQRFGRLQAKEYLFDNYRNQACWLFECDCGKNKILPISSVFYNNVKSCGCLRAEHTRNLNLSDIKGIRFGRLVPISPTEKRDASGSVIWNCRCDCGNESEHSVAELRKGSVKSCGCFYKETRSETDQYRRDKRDNTNLSQLVAAKTLRANNSSGNTGVFFINNLGKWEAYISFQKKRYYLGLYSQKEDAIKARRIAEERLHDPMILENIDKLSKKTKNKFKDHVSA